jgi:hypothetical protein
MEPDGPDLDRIIDGMLTVKFKDCHDPLDPGSFPSLGFDGEETGGNYFMEIKRGNIRITIWRIIQPNGAPETYNIQRYTKCVFNGVTSWGSRGSEDKFTAESLLHAQAIIHHLFTLEGNPDG